MKTLLTQIRVSPGGGESRSSTEIESGSIAIGRGTDQQVHVPDPQVALAHARLFESKPGRYQLEVLSDNGILVNGTRSQGCNVTPGDTIELGNSIITIEKSPAGVDLALSIVRKQSTGESESLKEKDRHSGSGWIRLASWAAFLIVLFIGLIDPVINHYAPEKRKPLETLSLPGPDFWLPGPVAPPHEYFGHDCSTCHDRPFHPVADENCQECHQDVAQHMPSIHEDTADPATQRCEACHLEHGGAEELVMSNQAFCADCHLDTQQFTGKPSEAGPATDFGTQHPTFAVTLTQLTLDQAIQVRLPVSEAREASNLKFPHDVHLDTNGIESPDGTTVMACVDCHQTEVDGGLMASISFEAHCSDCHQLAFDLSAPQRTVPHGDPQAALDVLIDFYAQLALRGGSEEVSIPNLEAASPAAALDWARAQSHRVAADLIEDRTCGQCHQVERIETADTIGWRIPQVFLTQVWLPGSQFSHESHEVAECEDCHAASTSSVSEDVLMPDIDTCQTCHGGEQADQMLSSTCVDCHRFHNPEAVFQAFDLNYHEGHLSLEALPDLEAIGRTERGVDSKRRRPGDVQ